MFHVGEFLEKPSTENLDKCKKDDWINLAKHLQIPVKSCARKCEIRELVKEDIMPSEAVYLYVNNVVNPDVENKADPLEL